MRVCECMGVHEDVFEDVCVRMCGCEGVCMCGCVHTA